jgi:hypothetical protein
MDNFRDLSALQGLLRSAYEKCAAEERHTAFVYALKKELGFTTARGRAMYFNGAPSERRGLC